MHRSRSNASPTHVFCWLFYKSAESGITVLVLDQPGPGDTSAAFRRVHFPPQIFMKT